MQSADRSYAPNGIVHLGLSTRSSTRQARNPKEKCASSSSSSSFPITLGTIQDYSHYILSSAEELKEHADMSTAETVDFLKDLLSREKLSTTPKIGKVSIALGIVEDSVISGKDIPDPHSLGRLVEEHYRTLQHYAKARIDLNGPLDARAKVALLAQCVWSNLRCSKKDIIHAQHLYRFTKCLDEGEKTQMCCAGVTTSVLCLAECLVDEHDDLKHVRLAITEDHCFISLNGTCNREDLAEVTTECRKARGFPPEEHAYSNHWLYAGGRPVVCSPLQALVACVVSMHFSISGSGKGVSDSLFSIQQALLEHLYEKDFPMYPNALATLATMKEESEWVALDAQCSNMKEVLQEFDKSWVTIRTLYKTAIDISAANEWYPSSLLATSYSYEHELLQMAIQSDESLKEMIHGRIRECLIGFMEILRGGSEVLCSFCYHGNHDEELFKDIDDVISKMSKILQNTSNIDASLLNQATVCQDLVKTFDHLLVLFCGKTLPSKWSRSFVTCLGLFSREERQRTLLNLSLSSKTLEDGKFAMIECTRRALLPALEIPSLLLGQDVQGRQKKRRFT